MSSQENSRKQDSLLDSMNLEIVLENEYEIQKNILLGKIVIMAKDKIDRPLVCPESLAKFFDSNKFNKVEALYT